MAGHILEDVKKALGLAADYTAFDPDVVMHTNTVFSTLNQLGVGPEYGFMIEDNTATWISFMGVDPRLNHIKTYVFLRVRLLFDPPSAGYWMDSVTRQITELEWRINVQREDRDWVDSDPSVDQVVLDGGGA